MVRDLSGGAKLLLGDQGPPGAPPQQSALTTIRRDLSTQSPWCPCGGGREGGTEPSCSGPPGRSRTDPMGAQGAPVGSLILGCLLGTVSVGCPKGSQSWGA